MHIFEAMKKWVVLWAYYMNMYLRHTPTPFFKKKTGQIKFKISQHKILFKTIYLVKITSNMLRLLNLNLSRFMYKVKTYDTTADGV